MIRTRSGLAAGLAALVVGVLGSVAQAGDAEDLARACIHRINTTAEKGVERMQEATRRTVGVVRHLNENGGTDDEITEAGRRGHARVARIHREAGKRVMGMVRYCVAELEEMDADPALIDKVRRAGAAARDQLAAAAENLHAVINRAVHRALND